MCVTCKQIIKFLNVDCIGSDKKVIVFLRHYPLHERHISVDVENFKRWTPDTCQGFVDRLASEGFLVSSRHIKWIDSHTVNFKIKYLPHDPEDNLNFEVRWGKGRGGVGSRGERVHL